MKHILLFLSALCLYTAAYSCSCGPDVRGFCRGVAESQGNPMFCVVQAKIISWYHWGMKVKVLDQVRANASNDTIVVWGDNGACCRPTLGASFHLGDTIVMCLERTDFAGNDLSSSAPHYELATHYMLQGCGAFYMRYKSGKMVGLFDDNTVSDTIEYNDFKNRVYHCMSPAGVTPAEPEMGISVYPNPATETIHVSAPTGISVIRLYNSVGQCVFQKNTSDADTDIDLSHMAAGMYTLTVYDADRKTISHHKVIRQ